MEDILKNREWKEFFIKNLFKIYTGAQVSKHDLGKGQIPRITASEVNNGIADFHRFTKNKNYRELTNFISISFLGGIFYHPYTASLDMKIHAVQLNNKELNHFVAKFLIIAIKRMALNYSYGNQLASKDLPNKKILLPVTSAGQPDYAFMESYMQELEQKKIAEYKAFIINKCEKMLIGGG